MYIYIIRILHLDNRLPKSLENNFAVHSILRGNDRIRSHVPKRKLPITSQLLIMFYEKLDFKSKVDISFFAACVVGFFSLSSGNPRYYPPRFPGTNIRHSKSIQCNERILRVPLLPSASKLCPVRALCNMWALAPELRPMAHLFWFSDRGQVRCLEYCVFVDRIRQLFASWGLNPDDYSGHSFRRGGCTWAWKNSPLLRLSWAREIGDHAAGWIMLTFPSFRDGKWQDLCQIVLETISSEK